MSIKDGEVTGAWWLPSQPDTTAGGVCRIDERGRALLHLFDPLPLRLQRPGELIAGEYIWGEVRGRRPITLIDSYEVGFTQGVGGVHNDQRVEARAALEGLVHVKAEDMFSAIEVKVEELGRWALTSRYSDFPPIDESSEVIDHVVLTQPPEVRAEVSNGNVHLNRFWDRSHSVDGFHAVAQASWLFSAAEPVALKQLLGIGERPLYWMTLLLTGRSVALSGVRLRVEDNGIEPWKRWVDVYGQVSGHTPRASQSLLADVAVELDDLGDRLPDFIQRYWGFHESYGAVFWPLIQQLVPPESLPLEPTFFMLTVCAEAYHRRRGRSPRSKNLKLEDRLNLLGEEFGVAPRVQHFAEWTAFIARCRNAIAHGSFSSDDLTARQIESVIRAEEVLQFLLHACVLAECGLALGDVHRYLARQPRYRLGDLGLPTTVPERGPAIRSQQ